MSIFRIPLLVIAATAICQGGTLTGTGSLSYYCLGPSPGEPLPQTVTSSASSASLTATCPGGYSLPVSSPSLTYSSSFQALSISAASYAVQFGGSATGEVTFDDELTVFGPASGFLMVSGEMDVLGGSDQTSFLNAGMALNGMLFSDAYTNHHGSLEFSDTTGSATHTYTDTGTPPLSGAFARQFTFYVPFVAGTPMDFSGFMNVRIQGSTIQQMEGSMSFALSVMDGNLIPVGATLTSESGLLDQSPVPEPGAWILAGPALLLILGARRKRLPVS